MNIEILQKEEQLLLNKLVKSVSKENQDVIKRMIVRLNKELETLDE